MVFAIAPSNFKRGLIWAGTNDGKIWYTTRRRGQMERRRAEHARPARLGTITSIQPSFFDAGTAYVSFDLHLIDNRDPFIFKTTDFGKTWKRIASDLPKALSPTCATSRKTPT